jgi:hypothetical protein
MLKLIALVALPVIFVASVSSNAACSRSKTITPRSNSSVSSAATARPQNTAKQNDDLSLDKTEPRQVPSNIGMYSNLGGSRGGNSSAPKATRSKR